MSKIKDFFYGVLGFAMVGALIACLVAFTVPTLLTIILLVLLNKK